EPPQWPPGVVRSRGPNGIRPARAAESTGAPGVGGDGTSAKVGVSALEDALKRAAPTCVTEGAVDYLFCA
ncbi:hypothetical protein, partial [Pseudarthrobacter sp. NamE2]|uniref:hypothetical protein n=1 Tax=Pseudarthrobacter sp. NamE2 TaxID=2576838 RepID=UPI00197B0061